MPDKSIVLFVKETGIELSLEDEIGEFSNFFELFLFSLPSSLTFVFAQGRHRVMSTMNGS